MRSILVTTIIVCTLAPGAAMAAERTSPAGLVQWSFMIGDWKLVEKRYGFDSKLIQTNMGEARFTYVLSGQRIQEHQMMLSGADTTRALHVFVYDPRSEEIEIARTDSGHFGFSLLIGTMSEGRMDLKEKHPNREHDVVRRVSYRRLDADHFTRQLEFSTDKGESWFVRSEWAYTRK